MKIRIKQISFTFFVYLMVINPFLSGDSSESMKIRLRLNNGQNVIQSPDNLKLLVNRKEVPITGIKMHERYIGKERLLGRNFVLSFLNFDKVDNVVENAVSYFVTEVLDKSDTLVVHTNVDIHPIKVTENKERMIIDITKRLERDMNYLSRKSSRIVKSINTEIAKLERFFSRYSPSSGYVPGGAGFFQFFATLLPDIQFYKNEFIIPDKKKFAEINNQFGFREGDRYWILLQNGNVYPFTGRIKNLVKSVRRQLSVNVVGVDGTWLKMVNNKIRELMEMIGIGSHYPVKTMREVFVNSNTSFFPIVHIVEKLTKSDKVLDIELENVLGGLAKETGGKFIETTDIEKGIGSILDHVDRYWDISFKIPSEMSKVKFKVTLDNESRGLIYREQIDKDELKKLSNHLSKPKTQIENPELKNNKLSFSIRSFTLSKRGGFGLLKVIIQIYDLSGKEVYRRSNTLRAADKKINISTGIPAEFCSGHQLHLSVLDMIANSLVVSELTTDK